MTIYDMAENIRDECWSAYEVTNDMPPATAFSLGRISVFAELLKEEFKDEPQAD